MSFEYTTPAITKWRLDDFMGIVDEFEDVLADMVHHKFVVNNDYQTILLHIAGKTLVTIREILTLCAHGYSDGALSLGRNLYEQMMIASFFNIHKNDADFQSYVDDFFLSYEAQRNKFLSAIGKYADDDSEDELKKEMEALKKRTKRKIQGDYWWAGCSSFANLIERVMQEETDLSMRKFLGVHYIRYKRACISLHAGCMGNALRIGNEANMALINTAPSVYGQSTPLDYAAVSMTAIVGFLCDAFEIDFTKYRKILNELIIFYQDMELEDDSKNA